MGRPCASRSDPLAGCGGVHCALSDSSLTRVSVAIQFTSQVLPPSAENACSKWQEAGVTSDQTCRTKMFFPLNDSLSMNSPRPFLNSPLEATLRIPFWLLAYIR